MEKELKNTKMTKEEIAKAWKEYYDWLKKIYPIESFEIVGKDKQKLRFYHLLEHKPLYDENMINYSLIDDEDIEYFEEQKSLHLQGEESPENEKLKDKGFISINKNEKWFNFGIDWDYIGQGYGKVIYDNISHILEILDIEDREQYKLRIYGNSNHDFLKRMDTQKLIEKTNNEPNTENALKIIEEFAKYPNTIKFSELNKIIEYAIKSGVTIQRIAEAINDNGFNISDCTFNNDPCFKKEDLEKFKSFGITGIKATCLHNHFMRERNFALIKLIDEVDMQDATLEFRNIFEEVRKEYKKGKAEGVYISPNLEKFGEAEHIILDWRYFGLLLKKVKPEIKKIIKEQSIIKFEEFDPERKFHWKFQLDYNSATTLAMLRDAGLMDKEAYIKLYQKALNRNYSIQEFDSIIYRFIDNKERELARREIFENVYYPSPKGDWQNLYTDGKDNNILKIKVPQKIIKKGNVRETIKKEIIKQGIAKTTKIKTDMTGISKEGETFVVDNLKDWLFGVHGATGNLKIIGIDTLIFPPQTPKFAIDLIQQTFESLENPSFGGNR